MIKEGLPGSGPRFAKTRKVKEWFGIPIGIADEADAAPKAGSGKGLTRGSKEKRIKGGNSHVGRGFFTEEIPEPNGTFVDMGSSQTLELSATGSSKIAENSIREMREHNRMLAEKEAEIDRLLRTVRSALGLKGN